MKRSLIALALLACAMAVAQAAPTPDIAIASMKMDVLASGVKVESALHRDAHRFGSLTFAKASKGSLARDSPHCSGHVTTPS